MELQDMAVGFLNWCIAHPELPGVIAGWMITRLPRVGPALRKRIRNMVSDVVLSILNPVLLQFKSIQENQEKLIVDQAIEKTMLWHMLSSSDEYRAFKIDSNGSLIQATPSILEINADVAGPNIVNLFRNGSKEKFNRAVKEAVEKGVHINTLVDLVDGKSYVLRGTPIITPPVSLGVFCTLHVIGV